MHNINAIGLVQQQQKRQLRAPAQQTPESTVIAAIDGLARPLLDRLPTVGVVGCGYWGSKHVRVLSGLPTVGQVAIIEQNESLRQRIQASFPAVQPFATLDEALPHVDAVVIATPPETHAMLCTMALRAGKHVLVEKPLAPSLDAAREMVATAYAANRVLMVGHTFQYNPAVRELRRRIDAGELGSIYYIHSARLNLGLYRPDVNVVWDLAPHDVTIMNYLLQAVPTSVTAWGAALACPDREDLAHIRLDYGELGISAYVHLSWLDPNKVRRVTVVGTRRMAVYDDLAEERLRIYDRGIDRDAQGTVPFERPLSYRYGDICSPHIAPHEPLALEDAHFVDSIRNGTAPETGGEDGLAVTAILTAVDRSLRDGGRVAVDYGEPPAAARRNDTAA
jgi:predicted dehydrogenase